MNVIKIVITTPNRDMGRRQQLSYLDSISTGTNSKVYITFYKKNVSYLLDHAVYDEFERGNRDSFNILFSDLEKKDLDDFVLELKPIGLINIVDNWFFSTIEIYFNNELAFFANPDVWLNSNRLLWYSKNPLNVLVEIKTGEEMWSGTDNDIYINFYDIAMQKKSFKLDDPIHNDFERGSTNFYRIYNRRLQQSDLNRFSIEIKKDSFGVDMWNLASVKLYLDGRVIYSGNPGRWLNSDNPIWKNF